MPVSHIGLTVSHLPTSSSFFLAALQPLGYRFIGQQGSQIGLGIRDADFFLCQETPGVKAGAAHIAFSAPSRAAVRDFYAAALTAGARPNGAPAARTEDPGHFNAAVLDFDGNSIEVVFREEPDIRDDGTVIEHSRVLKWQKNVAESSRDDRSVISSRTTRTGSKPALLPAPSTVGSRAPPNMVRTVSEPLAVSSGPAPSDTSGDGAAKKIIGTLIGAAAGAAVAYAMCKSEQDSAKKEAEFNAFQQAKALAAQTLSMAKEQPMLSMQDPQPIYDTAPRTIVHRNISDGESQYSAPSQRSAYGQRAIEAPPISYHSPTYTSVAPTQVVDRPSTEYVPAASVAPSRSQFTARRSYTSPDAATLIKTNSVVSSVKPSTLISTFVPDQVPRRSSEGSVYTDASSRSKAESQVSRHTSTSTQSRRTQSRAASPPPASHHSKPASIVGSILGRSAASDVSSANKKDYPEVEEFDLDAESVAPSDSVSNAGSRRSHRSHKSSRQSESGSMVSKHSTSSKHSKSSKHSHSQRSHHSSSSKKSRHSRSRSPEEYREADEYVRRPSVVSEPSDASTIRPSKVASSRKDSIVGGQYDKLFEPKTSYGPGTVASLPMRGITPSMIEESRGGKQGKRSVVSYAIGS